MALILLQVLKQLEVEETGGKHGEDGRDKQTYEDHDAGDLLQIHKVAGAGYDDTIRFSFPEPIFVHPVQLVPNRTSGESIAGTVRLDHSGTR